jgi:hypothetical protein
MGHFQNGLIRGWHRMRIGLRCGAQPSSTSFLGDDHGINLPSPAGYRHGRFLANAGHGLGGSFLEQDFEKVQHVIDTNVTGTIYLIQHLARGMTARGQGRILVTGSIAGFQPGAFHAVYNGSKAFIDSFAQALRNEMRNTGVTVSLLMPDPPTPSSSCAPT